jgi:Ion transport protein
MESFLVFVTYAITNKSDTTLSCLLDYFESAKRVVSKWKMLTSSDEFVASMKAMLVSNDGGKLFFRCVILFIKFLDGAASKNESERNELLDIKTSIEDQVERFLEADYFDDVSNVLDLLFLGEIKTKDVFISEKSIIGYCMDNNVKILFNNSTIVSTLNGIFRYCPSAKITDYTLKLFDIKVPMYIRFSPLFMFILEVLSKCLMLLVIGVVSINDYGALYGSDYSSVDALWSHSEVLLAVLLFSVILHEIGELWDSGLSVRRYFYDSWNILDLSSSMMGIIWFSVRFYPSHFTVSRVALALQAIPEALGLLRYLSVNQSLGQLVIMVGEMARELAYFIILYLVSLVGFSICLRGLFYGDVDYTSNSSTALSVFTVTFGQINFSAFSSNNDAVNTVGVLLIVTIIVFTAVLLINLLIAQMTNSYQRVKDQAFREWAFSYARVVKQCMRRNDLNVLTMLPAPLNLIPIALAVPHYYIMKEVLEVYSNGVDGNKMKVRYSLAGLCINTLFGLVCLPARHWRMLNGLKEVLITIKKDSYGSIFHFILNSIFLVVYLIFLPLVEVYYHLNWTFWKFHFDIMEEDTSDVIKSSTFWSFKDKRTFKDFNDDDVIINYYFPFHQESPPSLSMELFDKFYFLNPNKSKETSKKEKASEFQYDVRLKFMSLEKSDLKMEEKLNEVNSKMEEKLNEVNSKMEEKLNEVNSKMEEKLHDFDSKLDEQRLLMLEKLSSMEKLLERLVNSHDSSSNK